MTNGYVKQLVRNVYTRLLFDRDAQVQLLLRLLARPDHSIEDSLEDFELAMRLINEKAEEEGNE